MYKRIIVFFPYWFLIVLLFVSTHPVHAVGLSQPNVQDDGFFSFAQIREDEIHMFGPFATRDLLFGLPSTWELLDGAQLYIDMRVAVRSLNAQSSFDGQSSYVGTLIVTFNGQTIAQFPLENTVEDFTEVVQIPFNVLTSSRSDGRMELGFQLISGETCLLDQQLELIILSSSGFNFPHQFVEPDTSFLNFPRPIYQDTIFQDTARIVVPDQPTASELQGAFTVAAGLQARTGDEMALDLMQSNELTTGTLGEGHIIIVGKPSNLPLLSQLQLPLEPTGGQFAEENDVGVLQMVVSPWNPERVVLLVSGNTDNAVVKAAQALSTGLIRPNQFPNLALIDQVQAVSTYPVISTDQTLADLGYDNVVFEGRGETTDSFRFFIPIGLTVTSEAFIEISLNHTSLLDYDRSGLFVLLNDEPIGSVRFSDTTANLANNRIRISIPPSAVVPGANTMDLVILLNPVDDCSNPDQGGLFATVWADETRLFLPLTTVSPDLNRVNDLSAYPSPFTQSTTMEKTAFVVQSDSVDTWRNAMSIAENLGSIVDGDIMMPSLYFADDVPEAERSNYNFLVIGEPSKLPFITELNDLLPAPFPDGSDIALESDLQVIYKITPETPVGYVELLESPWNANNIVYGVFGNMTQGVEWAANALVVNDTRERLAGNFAVVNNTQVLSTDTRLSSSFEFVPPQVIPADESTPSDVISETTAKPSWVLPAMMVTGAFIVVIIVVLIVSSLLRRRRLAMKYLRGEEQSEE